MANEDLRPVQALLLQSLTELDAYRDGAWSGQVDALVDALLDLDQPVADTVRELVTAGAAIQQFLLELAIRPSDGWSRSMILDIAAWLIEGGDATTQDWRARLPQSDPADRG